MSTVKTPKAKLSLNIQRDYITLRTPNGNYTNSWGGAKASGKLAMHKTAFTNIDKFVMSESKLSSFGDAMNKLTDGAVLSTLWSEWDEVVAVNDFKATDKVVFTSDTMFSKKYPSGGVVRSVSRKNVFITLSDGKDAGQTIGFDYQILERI